MRGAEPGTTAEHQQVGQRVAAQAVRAVHAAGDLARGEQARETRLLGVGVDLHATHDVVAGRTDLHRLRRDVDVGQLLELVVHRRQLLTDRVGRQSGAHVEEDAAAIADFYASVAKPAFVDGNGLSARGRLVAEEIVPHLLDAPLWLGAIAPVAGLSVSAILLRWQGLNAATADEYLHAYHDPAHQLSLRALGVRAVAAARSATGRSGPR